MKNYSDNLHSSEIQKISQWKRCSTYLRTRNPNNQTRSMEWKQLTGKTLHGSMYLWLVMKKSSVSSAQRSVFSDSVLCLGKIHENHPKKTLHGNKDWSGSKVHRNTITWTELMESQWNSSGTFFPGFSTLEHSQEVKEFLLRLNETPENFTRRIIFMSMFNDISCGSRDNKVECESNAKLVSLYARRFGIGQCHFFFLVQKRSGILSVKIVHKVIGTKWQRRWCWHSQKADSHSSVPRVHCPEVSSKAQAVGHCRSTIV